MDKDMRDLMLKACLRQAREQLDRIVGTARAADICAGLGQTEKAVGVLLDVEPVVYEVRQLLGTLSVMRRMSQT